MKIIKKILGKRLTDNMLKILLLITVILITSSLILFWSRIVTLENKWFEIAKKKEVVVMDEAGNVWQKKLYSDANDIAVLFGFSFLKNSLSYNYKNYNKVYSYIQNLTSNSDINLEIREIIEEELKQIKIINGEYSVIINNYKVLKKGNVYKGTYLIKHVLDSETYKGSTNYIVNMDVSLEAPTLNNSSGFFISRFDREVYDPDKHENIFKSN